MQFDLFWGRKLSGEKASMVLAARVKPCSRLGFFVNEHIHRKTISKAQLEVGIESQPTAMEDPQLRRLSELFAI